MRAMTLPQASKETGIPVNLLREAVKNGELNAKRKRGGKVNYTTLEDIERWWTNDNQK